MQRRIKDENEFEHDQGTSASDEDVARKHPKSEGRVKMKKKLCSAGLAVLRGALSPVKPAKAGGFAHKKKRRHSAGALWLNHGFRGRLEFKHGIETDCPLMVARVLIERRGVVQ